VTAVALRRRQVHRLRELQIAHPAMRLQVGQNAPVCLIQTQVMQHNK
jgi:hypothetical protein